MIPNNQVNLAAPDGSQVIRAFILYLGLQLMILPAFAGVGLALMGKTEADWNAGGQHWFSIVAMTLTFVCVMGYSLVLQRNRHRRIWERYPVTGVSRVVAFLAGSASWLVVLPCVALVQVAVANILGIFVTAPPIEQVAVTHLRDTVGGDPWLFWLTVLNIVLLVPITEEILFRGFLQNWLTKRWDVRRAILGASGIFTLFHFSLVQGWTNIPILSALFMLAVILGALFQRFGSLWAPIGLHCTFNAASAWMVFIESP